MSDLPESDELFAKIDHRPPAKGWMDTPAKIRKGMYCYASNPKSVEYVGLHNAREWNPMEDDWKLPENWQQILHEGFKERLEQFRSFKVFMDICVRCGACSDKCHFFLGGGDPKNMPVLRAELLRSVYRNDFTRIGKLLGKYAGARPMTEDVLKEWWYYLFQCSECRRCSIFCPYGIDTAEITIMGRELLNLLGLNIDWVATPVANCYRTGNHLGIQPHAFKDMMDFFVDDIEEVTGVKIEPSFNRKGADILFITPSGDVFADPGTYTCMGYMMLFHYLQDLGLDITWSTYASEGGNFGFFTSHETMKRLNSKMYAEAKRLGVKWILGGECGHMWRVINQYMDTMNGPADFLEEPVSPITGTKFENAKSTKMVHISEFTADLIRHGKLNLDPSRNDHLKVTFHDSCNPSRGMGMFDEPRYVIQNVCNHFYEMPSNTIREKTITINADDKSPLSFYLSKTIQIIDIEVNGRKTEYIFKDGRLEIRLDRKYNGNTVNIGVRYEGIFIDPVPVLPVNTDNPGYGVTGTISDKGILLLAGAGWYPSHPDTMETFTLKVDAPFGMLAVTSGQSLSTVNENGRTVSSWEINHPNRGLALSVAKYMVKERSVGKITAATYLFQKNSHLADVYLDATVRYIQQYEALFGPYPFSKFAVVENFFPTGYGFPSYTLLGSRVLQLPFIPYTSLPHEIAHCWWGNGVYVDYSMGNWSEGLTTYVADYLNREKKSEKSGLDYRRQMLRNYASLVSVQDDFPLSRFESRYNPVTKTIGYDKSAMVFHMLRQLLGEDAFWGALQDIYRDNLFDAVSWSDIQKAFEIRGKRPLEYFFDQWIQQTGAIQLSLKNVSRTNENGRWKIKGYIIQKQPHYHTELKLSLDTLKGTIKKNATVQGQSTPFEIVSDKTPTNLMIDPEYDIFRRLYSSEIPASVNSIKGSSSVLVILSKNIAPESVSAAKLLIRSLGLNRYEIVSESSIESDILSENDILLVGFPSSKSLRSGLPRQIEIREECFDLNGKTYEQPSDCLFAVYQHPLTKNRVAAIFFPLSSQHAQTVARKITHYGKYSFLSFQQGKNKEKGVWPVTHSPLIVNWERQN